MAKTTKAKSTPSIDEEKINSGVEVTETTKTTEKTDNKDTSKDEEKEGSKPKVKELKFSDTDDVVIISTKRAGKSITANTLNVITFDEKGKATCKGLEARYLLESNLGFELGK